MNVLDIRGMPAHSPSKKAFGFFVGDHYITAQFLIVLKQNTILENRNGVLFLRESFSNLEKCLDKFPKKR